MSGSVTRPGAIARSRGHLHAAAQGVVHRLRRPPRTPVRPWTRAMTIAAALAFLASVAVGLLADAAVIDFVSRERAAPVLRRLASITDLGKAEWYLVPAALAVVFVGLADWSSHSRRGRARLSFVFGQAGFLFGAVALSGILVNVAKLVIGRARPRLGDEAGIFGFDPFGFDYLYHSYPSGHATTVGAVALVLFLWFPRLRPLVAVLALALGGSRVAALAHYPGDVVAGLAFGFLCSLWLARWLGARGVVFRVGRHGLLPVPRHALAWRAPWRRH